MPSDLPGEVIPTGGVGWSWLVPVSSKQPDLAMEWIDFMLSDPVMKKRAQAAASTMKFRSGAIGTLHFAAGQSGRPITKGTLEVAREIMKLFEFYRSGDAGVTLNL